jgi:hypothetical protein
MAQQFIMVLGFLSIEVSRPHSDTPHSEGLLWTSDQPDAETSADNTQQAQQTDIHDPGGVRTHSLSKRAAGDPRLRPCGHWDRSFKNYFQNCI